MAVHSPAARAAQRVVTRHGVPLLTWPAQEPDRRALAARRAPRVLVVAPGQAPPTDTDELEDWIREPIDPVDLDARVGALARRAERWISAPEDLSTDPARLDHVALANPAAPVIDVDTGIVRVGRSWVALSPLQTAVADLLLARLGEVVSRDDVAAVHSAGAGGTKPTAIKSLMLRLSKRLAAVGLTLHFVRGRGFMVELGTVSNDDRLGPS